MRRYWLDDETIHVQKRKTTTSTECRRSTVGMVEIKVLPLLWTPCTDCYPPDLKSLRSMRGET